MGGGSLAAWRNGGRICSGNRSGTPLPPLFAKAFGPLREMRNATHAANDPAANGALMPPKAALQQALVVSALHPAVSFDRLWDVLFSALDRRAFTSPAHPRARFPPGACPCALNLPFFMAESAHSCGPNFGFDRPHGCRPERRNCLALRPPCCVLFDSICVSYPEYDGSAAAAIGPTFVKDLGSGLATTGRRPSPERRRRRGSQFPASRAPSMVPMEPAAFPDRPP